MAKKQSGNWKYFGESGEEKVLKKIDESVAKRVLKVVDKGLVNGVGKPEPGRMCVEAAVCYAIGQKHDDDPVCVHDDVRSLKIDMNDSLAWSDDKARARGMRRLAIAQLGTTSMDIDKFQKAYNANLTALAEVIVEVYAPNKKADTKALEGYVADLKSTTDGYEVRELCECIRDAAAAIEDEANEELSDAKDAVLEADDHGELVARVDVLMDAADASAEDKRKVMSRLPFQIAEAAVQALITAKAQGAKFLHLAPKVHLK